MQPKTTGFTCGCANETSATHSATGAAVEWKSGLGIAPGCPRPLTSHHVFLARFTTSSD